MTFPAPADERPHPPADDPDWGESWSFEFFTDGDLGGYATLVLWPRRQASWYWAYLVGEGSGAVAVLDDEAPLPRPLGSLELRTEGLWADHICETALDHWTIGNEAFALRFDDPDEAIGRQRGDRVPLGFDLEWETDGDIVGADDGYAVPCRVHGEVLIEQSRLPIDGWGWRHHRWGVLRWDRAVMAGRLGDGTWVSEPAGISLVSAQRAPTRAAERSLARIRTSDGRQGRAWLTGRAAMADG